MQRSRGSDHGVVVSKICYNTVIVLSVVLCDCCKPVRKIELLATVSWTCGCQPFSCRCSQNVTHSRKEIYATSNLSKESIPAIPVGNSKHPTPTRSYCIMPIPSLQLEKKNSPMHRNRGFGHWVVVSKISYNAVIVLSVVLLLLQTNDSFVEIELLATVSWTCGCQPFSCRCSQNVTHCRKEICWTCFSWSTLGMLMHSQASRVVHVAISS